jgi:hypothetical protein
VAVPQEITRAQKSLAHPTSLGDLKREYYFLSIGLRLRPWLGSYEDFMNRMLLACFLTVFSCGIYATDTTSHADDAPSLSHGALKRILLVGKTGAGKTCFIQMAHEHCRKAKYNDKRDFIVPLMVGSTNIGLHQADCVDSTQSQTKEIKGYAEFDSERNVRLEFVDTQGLFDTQGVSLLDAQKQLAAYLAENPVNAIALVIPASDARITHQIEDMFRLLDGVFGDKRVRDHFLTFVTFSADRNENVELLVSEYISDPQKRVFYFDGSCVKPEDLKQTFGNDFRLIKWGYHAQNFNALLDVLVSLEPIESIVFRERAGLMREAESLISDSHHATNLIKILSQKITLLSEDIDLVMAHNYKKWSCDYVGETLCVNTTNTPVFAEKQQGGPAGWFGGTKTYLSHYNSTSVCTKCGGAPGSHSFDKYVNLRGQGETRMAATLAEREQQKEAACQQKSDGETAWQTKRERLQQINERLNATGQRRDYVADLEAQIDVGSE